jgi:hypothetical protein
VEEQKQHVHATAMCWVVHACVVGGGLLGVVLSIRSATEQR